ncbi:MAG: hypothetical protein J7L12_02265 [Desulfurococcales archaeon]|nr:hypothetical protein [Desulfurococcales archaeon]
MGLQASTCVSGYFACICGQKVWVINDEVMKSGAWASDGYITNEGALCCLVYVMTQGRSSSEAYMKAQSEHLCLIWLDPVAGEWFSLHLFSYVALYVDTKLNARSVTDHACCAELSVCTTCKWRS